MYATLTTAALCLAPTQPPETGRADPPRQPAAGAAPMIDGNWTIVVLEKNGQPVQDAAKHLTVSIRGNTVTFNKAGARAADTTTQPPGDRAGAGAGEMRAMRVDFGPNGTVRVTEAGADNKFGAQPAVPPGAPGNPSTGSAPGVRTGVYVLTQDYLAVCVHDTGSSIPRPGTTGTDRDRPGADRPATDRPGTDRPGAAQPGTGAQPGGTSGIGDGRLPPQRTYITVILRRDAGSRPAPAQ